MICFKVFIHIHDNSYTGKSFNTFTFNIFRISKNDVALNDTRIHTGFDGKAYFFEDPVLGNSKVNRIIGKVLVVDHDSICGHWDSFHCISTGCHTNRIDNLGFCRHVTISRHH